METFIVKLRIKPEHAQAFADLMVDVVPKVRNEPGNRAYICHRLPDDPNTFVFYEQYLDQDARQAHREHLGQLGIDLQEMVAAPPEYEYLELLA